MVPRNTFYQPVNKRSKAAMRAFLTQHFRYFTGNSWNASSSYACNMKLYHLGLPRELEDKLWDMLEVEEFYDPINQLRNQFAEEHDYQWQAAFNGRSGGYLVLYQGGRKPTGHKSYCTCCGQRNFTSVAETNNVCGRCGQHRCFRDASGLSQRGTPGHGAVPAGGTLQDAGRLCSEHHTGPQIWTVPGA